MLGVDCDGLEIGVVLRNDVFNVVVPSRVIALSFSFSNCVKWNGKLKHERCSCWRNPALKDGHDRSNHTAVVSGCGAHPSAVIAIRVDLGSALKKVKRDIIPLVGEWIGVLVHLDTELGV
jgi:hypothetical protein